MYRLQLIEQLDTQFAHVFRMLLFVSKPPRKTTGSHKQLARCGVVPVGFLAGERFPRNLLQQPFAHANAGERKGAQVQVTTERKKRDGSDGHHVGAVTPHRISLHALAHVSPENVWQPRAQER